MTSGRASGRRRLRVAVVGLLALAAAGAVATQGSTASPRASIKSSGPGCDEMPTGVAARDHWLRFKVPPGLMPDAQFDGRRAKLNVHRVSPVYANGKCPWVPSRAVVLIHGRTVPGPVAFDLRARAKDRSELSVQRALARAGIDTFAPSLLGVGRSTRFDEGLNDPGNASLRPYLADGACPYPEGCDRTHNPVFPLDQQGTMLAVHPLAGERRAHSSGHRFARIDVWVRDIRQVIADAIARAKPSDGKVVLLGYSAGAQRVGRTLYAANPILPASANVITKVSRVVFLSPLFGGPTEETPPPTGFATFPLTLNDAAASAATWAMPPGREPACTGHVIPGSQEQTWVQTMQQDTVGRRWGGDDPAKPSGLNRSPTFSGYGWNAAVAGQLSTPTLVIQGFEDIGVPGGVANASAIYDALPASMTNKVLVRVQCASHALPVEGCAGPRCMPSSGTPYGGTPGAPWAGPHATLTAALIEWTKSGTFNGAPTGRFAVDASGVASALGP